VSVLSNASGNWNWDFTSALFFASTVLSTTGRATPPASPGPGAPGLPDPRPAVPVPVPAASSAVTRAGRAPRSRKHSEVAALERDLGVAAAVTLGEWSRTLPRTREASGASSCCVLFPETP
jgi:hypothetical protein